MIMKRKLGAIIATALCFILTAVSVYADVRVWDMVDWAQLYLFELIFMRMSVEE